MDAIPRDTMDWCLGLPQTACVPLSTEEILTLRRERRRLLVWGWVLLLLFPFCLLGALLVLVALSPLALSKSVTMAVAFTVFLVAALVLATGKQFLTRAHTNAKNQRQGEKRIFAGVVPEELRGDPSLRRLLQDGYLQPLTEEQVFEVLAPSGRLWQVNAQPVRRWMTLDISTATNPPENAHIAAQWLEPIGEVDGQQVLGGQRELSAAEGEELRRIAGRLQRTPLVPALLLSLWSLLAVGFAVYKWVLPTDLPFYGLLGVTLLADAALLHGVLKARRLHRDLAEGFVFILQGSETPEQDPDDEKNRLIEVLSVSHVVWTVDGQPATWRRS